MQTDRTITFNEAILEAMHQSMGVFHEMVVIGLGVTDPSAIFGTTKGLREEFGKERVLDMPISENGVTGIAVGAASQGVRIVMTHQRADFILMAMDQIVNNAAKWSYMYGGTYKMPLVIRLIVGRGWGQGPQHSQNFQGFFAQVPGLKVIAPTTPYEAKGLLNAAIADDGPVICIEHRWLSSQRGIVPEEYYSLDMGDPTLMQEGEDVTVVSQMDLCIETLSVIKRLIDKGVKTELINVNSLKPLRMDKIYESVKKTGKVLVIDSGWVRYGVSAEISADIAENCFDKLRAPIKRLGLPDVPTPTSPALSNKFYLSEMEIASAIVNLAGKKIMLSPEEFKEESADVPDVYFKGPF